MPIVKVQLNDGKIINLGKNINNIPQIQLILQERFPNIYQYGAKIYFRDQLIYDFAKIEFIAQNQSLNFIKIKALPQSAKPTCSNLFSSGIAEKLQSKIQKQSQFDNYKKTSNHQNNLRETFDLNQLSKVEQQKPSQTLLNKNQQSSISISYSGFIKEPVKPREQSVYDEFDLNISQIQRGRASEIYSSLKDSKKISRNNLVKPQIRQSRNSAMLQSDYGIDLPQHSNMIKTVSQRISLDLSVDLPQITKKNKIKSYRDPSQLETKPSLKTCDSFIMNENLKMQTINENQQSNNSFQIQISKINSNQFKKYNGFRQKGDQQLIEKLIKEKKQQQHINPGKSSQSYLQTTKIKSYICYKCKDLSHHLCDLCKGNKMLDQNHPYIEFLSSLINDKVKNCKTFK